MPMLAMLMLLLALLADLSSQRHGALAAESDGDISVQSAAVPAGGCVLGGPSMADH